MRREIFLETKETKTYLYKLLSIQNVQQIAKYS